VQAFESAIMAAQKWKAAAKEDFVHDVLDLLNELDESSGG
jgi:hypothetical protein